MATENDVKSYVRPDNTAVINCPQCKRQKEIKVEKFTGNKSRLKIKCACKKVFQVQLEYRKRYRKNTNLSGKYINHTKQNSSGRVDSTKTPGKSDTHISLSLPRRSTLLVAPCASRWLEATSMAPLLRTSAPHRPALRTQEEKRA